MTQLTLFSMLMAYFWLMVGIAFAVVSVMRRRRLSHLELAYIRSNPPMPYIFYRSSSDTQEVAVAQIPAEAETRHPTLRHINPSEQVTMEIYPDGESASDVEPETNLHRIFARLTEGKSPEKKPIS